MLAPEQILHAAMILGVESKDGIDEDLISQVQEALECDSEDHDAALSHIEKHRDEGQWGGRQDAVLNRSRERVREAMENGTLPSDGKLGDLLVSLIGEPEDISDIDPFEELGVSSGGGGFGAQQVAGDDPLAAFMDGDDEEEDSVVDEQGFLSKNAELNLDGEVIEDDEDEEPESEPEPEPEPEEDEEVEEEPEPEPATSPDEAYEMLMSTCWIDGILDPAEAKLLARKRSELDISFEQHLQMLQIMLERSS